MENRMLDQQDAFLFEAVSQLKNGTLQDDNRVYELSCAYMNGLASSILGKEESVDAVLEKAYLSIYNEVEQLTDPSLFYYWAGKIVTDQALKYVRESQPSAFSIVEPQEDFFFFEHVSQDQSAFLPESFLTDLAKQKMVVDYISQLALIDRICVQYYYYDGATVSQIAESLSCSPTYVKKCLNQVRTALYQIVSETNGTPGTQLYSLASIPVFFMIGRNVANNLLAGAVTMGSSLVGATTGATVSGFSGNAAGSAVAGTVPAGVPAGQAFAGAAPAGTPIGQVPAGQAFAGVTPAGTPIGQIPAGQAFAGVTPAGTPIGQIPAGQAFAGVTPVGTPIGQTAMGTASTGAYQQGVAMAGANAVRGAGAATATVAKASFASTVAGKITIVGVSLALVAGGGTATVKIIENMQESSHEKEKVSQKEEETQKISEELAYMIDSYEKMGIEEAEIEEHLLEASDREIEMYTIYNEYCMLYENLKEANRNCLSDEKYELMKDKLFDDCDMQIAMSAMGIEDFLRFVSNYEEYDEIQTLYDKQIDMYELMNDLMRTDIELLNDPLSAEIMEVLSMEDMEGMLQLGYNVQGMVQMYVVYYNDGTYDGLVDHVNLIASYTDQYYTQMEDYNTYYSENEVVQELSVEHMANASDETKDFYEQIEAYYNELLYD